jgi:hypothetical protein
VHHSQVPYQHRRFDHQVKANDGVGMAPVSDALRAMDFISKLDQNIHMRNKACQNIQGSYPAALAAAFKVASSWTKDGGTIPMAEEQHSAFLADNTPVTKSKNYNSPNILYVTCLQLASFITLTNCLKLV